jgi:hypothetical protein
MTNRIEKDKELFKIKVTLTRCNNSKRMPDLSKIIRPPQPSRRSTEVKI